MNWKSINKPCKKLLISCGSASSGRNNAGRITIWHRGGGSKRLIRNVDLKRNTPSVGIVERIEYDPNRSSNIALVRWTEGVQLNKTKEHFTPAQRLTPEPIKTTVSGQFPLGCLSANPRSDQNPERGKIGNLKDVFNSAFASSGKHGVSSLNIPRIAVAGAMPSFFAPQVRGEVKAGEEKEFSLSDVRKWNKDSVLWVHRSKRKAAVSWQSLGGRAMPLGFVETEDDKKKPKSVQGRLVAKPTGKAPISYILASHELQVGQMVMNCDSTNPLPKQNAH